MKRRLCVSTLPRTPGCPICFWRGLYIHAGQAPCENECCKRDSQVPIVLTLLHTYPGDDWVHILDTGTPKLLEVPERRATGNRFFVWIPHCIEHLVKASCPYVYRASVKRYGSRNFLYSPTASPRIGEGRVPCTYARASVRPAPLVHICTVPAPYLHCTCTVAARTYTVRAPYLHHTCTVLAPYLHCTCIDLHRTCTVPGPGEEKGEEGE